MSKFKIGDWVWVYGGISETCLTYKTTCQVLDIQDERLFVIGDTHNGPRELGAYVDARQCMLAHRPICKCMADNSGKCDTRAVLSPQSIPESTL